MLEDNLELLFDDTSAMHMVNIARLNDQVHLFMEHTLSKPHVIEMLEYLSNGATKVSVHEKGEDGCESVCDNEGKGKGAIVLDEGVECEGEVEGEAKIHEDATTLGEGGECEGEGQAEKQDEGGQCEGVVVLNGGFNVNVEVKMRCRRKGVNVMVQLF